MYLKWSNFLLVTTKTCCRFVWSCQYVCLANAHQCAIPVLDGLLPEPYNTEVLTLLFVCSHWHALAKLRMHTEYTLRLFDAKTKHLGTCLRSFATNTCEDYETQELLSEVAARNRRNIKKATTTQGASSVNSSAKRKRYNLRTIKHHFLGDHPSTIRMFGTTDSHSTEPVSNIFWAWINAPNHKLI